MQLKKREDITVESWINEKVISTKDWVVYSEIVGDEVFFSIQEPNTQNQLKLKITKFAKFEPIEEKSELDQFFSEELTNSEPKTEENEQ